MKHLVYVGLGSNLQGPVLQIQRALTSLSAHAEVSALQHSSLYQSAPMGDKSQAHYVNAVACFRTALSAHHVLDLLQQIENQQGRTRTERWASRTLDLDLLLYDNEQINTPCLTVPHYGLTERAFVLVPLNELAPSLVLPDQRPLAKLMAHLDTSGLIKL